MLTQRRWPAYLFVVVTSATKDGNGVALLLPSLHRSSVTLGYDPRAIAQDEVINWVGKQIGSP